MKIKLLFFIESLEHGGAEKSLMSLLQHLDYSKYDVEVGALKKEGALKNLLPPEVKFLHINLYFGLLGKIKFGLLKQFASKRHNAQHFWKAFKNSIPKHCDTYDVAIAWGQGFTTYYLAEKIISKIKIAWVNTNYDEAGYIYAHDADIYKIYDRINGVSPFAVEILAKYIDAKKLIQITDIIDSEEVIKKSTLKCSTSFSSNVFNIVSVGRLAKPKAFELSIHAARILKEKGMKFHWYIVGDGSESVFLENRRKEADLENEITFTGTQDNPYAFIQQANLYVQTSRFEGLGRTLIEAAVLNKPIVTTDFDTAFTLVDQNQTGIITPKEPEAIAEAIFKLYNDKDTYAQMVENLKSKSRISAEQVVEEFDGLLQELLTSPL